MTLTQVNIHNVRNINQAKIALHPKFNIFHGVNGSGKTSVLEAVYLLGSGRSFRTRETAALLRHNETALTVFAKLGEQDSISIQKSNTGSTHVKLNQQPCMRSSELAHYLPCQVVYQDIFQIIDAGPAIRRSVLDWGLFHTQSSYNVLLKEYKHVLKQRNALLRQKSDIKNFLPWDKLLVSQALEIDKLRRAYFQDFSKAFQMFLAQLTDVECTISYYKGWDKRESGKDLQAILNEQFDRDRQRQYTSSGPHQADIMFDSMEIRAKQTLSRGQQKIILIALKMAQSHLLSRPCIYLFDDIISELDATHVGRFLKSLTNIDGQFFFTAIDRSQLVDNPDFCDAAWFSLRGGVVSTDPR
ncbi:MAG: DNA replication/repair protein RecF [Legionellaceae bacterium]|nr:DNA replication/repair protein RecF [Legionellaceae bacterium]